MGDDGGLGRLLNRAGTTFRKLPETDKTGLDEAKVIGFMLTQPSMIKRPGARHRPRPDRGI